MPPKTLDLADGVAAAFARQVEELAERIRAGEFDEMFLVESVHPNTVSVSHRNRSHGAGFTVTVTLRKLDPKQKDVILPKAKTPMPPKEEPPKLLN